MSNRDAALVSADLYASYWDKQPTDKPGLLNSFSGTWKISDNRLLPEALRAFVREMYPDYYKFSDIPVDKINQVLNKHWEGPGSMSKIARMTCLLAQRRTSALTDDNNHGDYNNKTIEEYTDEDFFGSTKD